MSAPLHILGYLPHPRIDTHDQQLGVGLLVACLDWPLCHCAVAQAPPFDEHRRPLAPSKIVDVCITEKNDGYEIL